MIFVWILLECWVLWDNSLNTNPCMFNLGIEMGLLDITIHFISVIGHAMWLFIFIVCLIIKFWCQLHWFCLFIGICLLLISMFWRYRSVSSSSTDNCQFLAENGGFKEIKANRRSPWAITTRGIACILTLVYASNVGGSWVGR